MSKKKLAHPMGLYAVFALAIMVAGGSYLLNQSKAPAVLGASIVGNESKEICWHGTKSAEMYQLYYGQASTGNKDTTIFAGLTNNSKCVKLSYLKPCTTYIWNLYRRDGGLWSWQWSSDQSFSTGGSCDPATPVTANKIVGNGKADVMWSVADGARKYYVFYRGTGDANWTHSVEVPPSSTSYTINYLDTNRGYMYRVAALVGDKLVWQVEKNLIVK